MSIRYIPAPFPQRFDESLLPWLYKELSRIGQLQALDRYDFPPLGAEPAKYETGTTVWANGTDWDPGGGAGLYSWDGTQWVLMSADYSGVFEPVDATIRRTGDDAATLGSDSASDGWVLTADGAGGAAWEALPAGSVHNAVTLAGTLDYLTIDGSQVITRGPINLGTDVTGSLPVGSVSGLAAIATTGAYSDLSGVPWFITASGVTYANLSANGSIGTGSNQVAQGNHTHIISNVTGLQTALDAKVAGPASATNNRIAVFDGTTGKLIKDGGSTIADLGGGGSAWAHYQAAWSDTSLTARTNVSWDDEFDPGNLASISGNDITIAVAGSYLITMVVDLGIVSSSSTTLRRLRTYLDWNDSAFWSVSCEAAQYATKSAVTLHRPYYLDVGDQLNLAIEDDQGTFGDTAVNVYLSLLKLG